MYVLYNPNTSSVLEIAEYIKSKDDYFIVERENIKIKFRCDHVKLAIVSKSDITIKDNVPLVYDDERCLVYPDPFYVEEYENDETINDNSSSENCHMSVSQMRTKILELEQQIQEMRSLLNTYSLQ